MTHFEEHPVDPMFVPPEYNEKVQEDLVDLIEIAQNNGHFENGMSYFFTRKGISYRREFVEFNIPYEEDAEGYATYLDGCFKKHLTEQYPEIRFIKRDRSRFLAYTERGLFGHYKWLEGTTRVTFSWMVNDASASIIQRSYEAIRPDGRTNSVMRLLVNRKSDNIVERNIALPTTVPLKDPKSMFPWFPETPQEVWEGFSQSDSNVLLLLGEPGTGKTSFIRELLHHRESQDRVFLADRDDVLSHPTLNDYIREMPKGSVLIVEDADKLVMRRDEGNGQMSGLLNATSGIVPTDTKIIISTNLATTKQVDEALIRPGRAYRILQFKTHNYESARKVRTSLDLPPVDFSSHGGPLTLAAITNYEMAEVPQTDRGVVGFT